MMTPTNIQTYPLISQEELDPFKNKHARSFRILGVLEIILGVTFITIAVVNINQASQLIESGTAAFVIAMVGSGIWTGTFVSICGILGLLSSRYRHQCPVIGALVVTILTSLSCFSLVMIEASGAVLVKAQEIMMYVHRTQQSDVNEETYESSSTMSVGDSLKPEPRSLKPDLSENSEGVDTTTEEAILGLMFQLHITLIVLGVIAFIMVVIHSSFTCASTCCKKNNYQGNFAMNSTQHFSAQPGFYQSQQNVEPSTEQALQAA